jgi:putative nucleotidyltransferase with HDIG domain
MDEDKARTLAERLLAAALPERWRHVQAVAAEAARLSDELSVDRRPVVSAAWLHDIGYAPAVADTGFHPIDGARYLREQGWDEEVCRLVAHHSDAARQADDQGIGEELRTEFAEVGGLKQDIVWAADATTGPNGERFTLVERIAEIHKRYGSGHPVAERMTASRDALEAAIARVAGAAD